MARPPVKGGYQDAAYGQIHYLWAAPEEPAARRHPPLICLHPTPYAGEYFRTLLPHLAATRLVLAPDLPGYGRSSPPPAPIGIAGYAGAIADWLDGLHKGGALQGPVDALGFHVGDLIAIELSLQRPELVRRLCLMSVPYYATREERAERRAQMVVDYPLTEDLACLAPKWEFTVKGRPETVPLARAFANFLSELHATGRHLWAYEAAYDYPAERRLAQVTHPALILNPQDMFAEHTRRAAKAIPSARLVEMPDISRGPFEGKVRELMKYITEHLDA